MSPQTAQITCPSLAVGETADAALGGAVRLIQPKKGYRFSIDAVLLARFAAERGAEKALDLGTGCGVVGLCLLHLGGVDRLVGLDIQPDMVDRARRAARWNGDAKRADFVVGDLRTPREYLRAVSFPLVVANPPYRAAGAGRLSPVVQTAVARHEVSCTLKDVVGAARWALTDRGDLCIVYPASRLASLMHECRAQGLEPRGLRTVHPRAGEPASLVLLRCRKGGGEGLEVRAPLILHDSSGRYSQEAETLLGLPRTGGTAPPGGGSVGWPCAGGDP